MVVIASHASAICPGGWNCKDVTGHDVVRAKVLESTGFGAALLAGLGSGIFGSMEELRHLNPAEQTFSPATSRHEEYQRFIQAVELTSNWS